MIHGPRRHLLVLAPQCASMPRLTRLDEAASALHAALGHAELGGCDPALPDGRSLYADEGLTSEWIRTLIREAIRHAAERRASLVLALLGHGFVPGTTNTLYLMGADSTEDETEGAVNVGELLAAAANRLDIPSVLGIVDTCHAAGALPPGQDLTAGAGNGRSRLAVLMASSLTQPAVDLSFSRALAGLIREGLPGAGPLLGVDDVHRALRGSVVGQNVTVSQHDGDPFATEPVWVTRNRRDQDTDPGGLLGRLVREEIGEAYEALGTAGSPAPPAPHDVTSGLEALAALKGLARSPARDRAIVAADGLLIAARTVAFLRDWLGGELTTARLRQALRALLASEQRTLSAPMPEFTDVAILDRLVVDFPMSRQGCRPSVTAFVVRLVLASGKDPGAPELHTWARTVHAQQELNDAVTKALDDREDRQLRLAVSLDSSLTGGWPETVGAWLLQDGELLDRRDFGCPTADRRGAEAAIEAAALWAEDHAEALGRRLRRLDVAVPSGVLLEWRPEEAGESLRFGVQYDVVVHWSRRLAPDPLLRRIQGAVSERWEEIAACSGVPVDWLEHADTADRPPLQGRLRDGRYRRGIGLTHRTGLDDQLMEILLSYTPVLLWPRGAEGFPVDRHGCLEPQWLTMPEGLGHAYQRRWRGEHAGDLADLRAVWDDREWLRFCRLVRSTVPPVHDTIKEAS